MRYLLLLPLLLAGCSGGTPDDPDMNVIAPETFTFAVPDGATEDQLLGIARRKCEGETHCKVMGWRDPGSIPTNMPMLTREVNAQTFSYTLNRAADYEQVLVDCDIIPATPVKCLADIDEEPDI